MGIQINGQTDTITASSGTVSTPGNVSSSGIVTATQVKVGSAVTIHSGGYRVGSSDIHSTGIVVNTINSSGLSTFSGGIQVGATTSIIIGSSFVRDNVVGIGTTTTTGRNAGVGTARGSLIFNITDGVIQAYNGSTWADVASIGDGLQLVAATGGTITELANPVSGTDRLHSFYSSDTSPATGTFTVSYVSPLASSAQVLVVGAGGDRGANCGGGGGGLYISPSYPLSVGSYPIVAGGANPSPGPGADTTAFGLTAGGGGGNTAPTTPGQAGRPAGGNGAGGGGVWGSGGNPGGPGAPIAPSGTFTGYGGNPGGANAPGANPNGWGGGGGGSGGVGGNATGGGPGGSGGAGVSSNITGISTYYGVGGAGSSGTQATGAMYRAGSGNGGYYGGPQAGGGAGGYAGSPGGVYIRYKWKN